MSVSERLAALHSQIAQQSIEGDAAIAELRSLLSSVADPYQREKIEEALNWAQIYFRSENLDQRGSPETVRAHLQMSIYKASLARKARHDLN